MEKIKIITDSTLDLPSDIVKEKDIEVLPLLINFGEESYLDGVEINTKEMLDRIERDNIKKVIMDFKEVTFMDSSGIGVVIGRLKKIKNRDGKVCITNVNKRVDKVFTLSGLYKIITVYNDVNEALANI